MQRATMWRRGQNTNRARFQSRQARSKRQPSFERLEDRVALSGLVPTEIPLGHKPELTHGASTAASAAASLVAGPATYYTSVGKGFTVPNSQGIINAVKNTGVSGVYINIIITSGHPLGTLQYPSFNNTYGVFTYTPPSMTFTGKDTFSYQATNGTIYSNIGTVTVNVGTGAGAGAGGGVVPNTPYYDYLRKRRDIDPARFDYYHPRIGCVLGMESAAVTAGDPVVVPVNKDFSVTAAQALHAEDPTKFDLAHPILGALLQLETPSSDPASLLPKTAFFNEQRVLYESDPTAYQVKHVYLGAIFAIESLG